MNLLNLYLRFFCYRLLISFGESLFDSLLKFEKLRVGSEFVNFVIR